MGGATRVLASYETYEKRFWAKVDSSGGIEACWPHGHGTGRGSFYFMGEYHTPARVALMFHKKKKQPPPSIRFVCHTCDNEVCCNPYHLVLANNAWNMQDMASKGRANPPRGSQHLKAKLTEAQVEEIRRIYQPGKRGMGQFPLAARYNVSRSTIQFIIQNKTWTHVD